MIRPATAALAPADGVSDDARLRQTARQLEGVFMEYLFKAMRETVPQDGVIEGGSGESIFTGLFDQHVADAAAARQENGLGDALYRQLAATLRSTPIGTGS
jgi:flagellar protein FlgJ